MAHPLLITSVHLRVADLARSLDYYTRQLGFVVVNATPTRAELTVTTDSPALLTLTGDSSAPLAQPDAAGLFHAALLFPSRPALATWLNYAAAAGVAFEGASDHGVSEAIYFSDPDGNGLEFYVDRPRSAWPFAADGRLAMITQRLDLASLLATATTPSPTPLAGARWGHLHLRVTDLDRSDAFYRETLGMVVTQGSYPGARFLAADGYHHHLGLNTWGRPRTPRHAAALGLVSTTFAHPTIADTRQLADPDGIALTVAAARP